MSVQMVSFIKLVLTLLAWVCTAFAIDLTTCGITKTCIFRPQNCTTVNSTCFIFTYQYVPSTNTFNMELSGGSGGGDEYNAVAFSFNGLMENSDLYYCTGQSLKTGTIGLRHLDPTTDNGVARHVSNIAANTTNGVGECTFTRTARVVKNIGQRNLTFDLVSNRFYIIQASGEFLSAFGFAILFSHDMRNRWSSGPYNLNDLPIFHLPLVTSNIITPTTATIPATTFITTTITTISTTTIAATTPTTTNTTTTSSFSSFFPPGSISINLECGTSRSCFKDPAGCVTGNVGCMFTSWFYDESTNSFEIIIIGGSRGMYAAIAFAPSPRMQNADLYFCTEDGLRSGAIQARNFPPLEQTELPSEITQVTNRIENGALVCVFNRPASVEKPVFIDGVGSPIEFNLVTNNYFLLYAVGVFTNKLRYHRMNRTFTNLPINFTTRNQEQLIEDISTPRITTRNTPVSTTSSGNIFGPTITTSFILMLLSSIISFKML